MNSSPIQALVEFLTRSNENITRERTDNERFRQMLTSEKQRGKRPVALVRRNKDVSFKEIPFFDKNGERIAVRREKKNGRERVVVQHRNRRKKQRTAENDTLRQLEARLSEQQRVDRAVPGFRKAAAQLLRETEELRRGILSGKLETPGMKVSGYALQKGVYNQQYTAHLPDRNGGSLAPLGMRLALKTGRDLNKLSGSGNGILPRGEHARNGTNGTSGDIAGPVRDAEALNAQLEAVRKDLPDPRAPQIRKFEPPRITASGALHRKSIPLNGKEADRGQLKISDSSHRGRLNSADPPPLERIVDEHEQAKKLLASLRNSPLERHSQTVREMVRTGWKIKAPATGNHPEGKKSNAESGSSQGGKTSGGTTGISKEKLKQTAKPERAFSEFEKKGTKREASSVKAPSVTVTGSAQTDSVSLQQSSNPAAPSTSEAAFQAQQPRTLEGAIENLHDVLRKIEGKARLLRKGARTTLHIRLQPKGLGLLTVRIVEEGKRYRISLKTRSKDALKHLETAMTEVRAQLTEMGINVEDVTVQAERFVDFERDSQGQGNNDRQRPGDPSKRRADSRVAVDEASPGPLRKLVLGTNTVDYIG